MCHVVNICDKTIIKVSPFNLLTAENWPLTYVCNIDNGGSETGFTRGTTCPMVNIAVSYFDKVMMNEPLSVRTISNQHKQTHTARIVLD